MLKIVNAVLVAKAIGPKTKAMRFGLKVGGSRPRPDLEDYITVIWCHERCTPQVTVVQQ